MHDRRVAVRDVPVVIGGAGAAHAADREGEVEADRDVVARRGADRQPLAAIGFLVVAGVALAGGGNVDVGVRERHALVVEGVVGIVAIPRCRLVLDPLVGNRERLHAGHRVGGCRFRGRRRPNVRVLHAEELGDVGVHRVTARGGTIDVHLHAIHLAVLALQEGDVVGIDRHLLAHDLVHVRGSDGTRHRGTAGAVIRKALAEERDRTRQRARVSGVLGLAAGCHQHADIDREHAPAEECHHPQPNEHVAHSRLVFPETAQAVHY